MLTALELEGMQATSRSALPDIGTITRSGDGGTLDVVTGLWSSAAAAIVYGPGPVRVRPPAAQEMETMFGDTTITTTRYVLTLPHDAPALQVDDRLTVSESSDAEISVVSCRVVSVPVGSWLIDRRCGVEVVE